MSLLQASLTQRAYDLLLGNELSKRCDDSAGLVEDTGVGNPLYAVVVEDLSAGIEQHGETVLELALVADDRFCGFVADGEYS